MEYSSKQDFGNLGNLVVYLNGKQNISERLKIGKKIFYISSKMPPQHKEEVIIVWLMDILSTNKVLTFTDEEVVLIWRTLREFFSSKRLKGLCLNHWICPITPPFVQTLMRTSCEKAPREIQQEALSICECLLKMSTFSPQVMILTKQSFRLLTGVLKLTLETHSFSLFQSLIIMLLQKVTFVISNEMTKENVMSLVFENQALNLLEILFELKKKNSEYSELIKEIENYLNLVLFADESMNGYSRIFDLNIFKINESSSLRIGESFYSFISALLTKSDKEKTAYILKEFYTCFFQTFKRSEELIFYAINVSMHLLGLSYESGVVEVEKSASTSMIPVKLNKIHKYMFASCILESLLLAEVNVEFTSSEVSFKDFINSLFRELIFQKHPNEFMLQSLIFIIRMGPYLISEHLDLFGNLLLLNREDSSLNEKVDEIFCIILSLNQKCRTVDEFLEKLSHVLLSLDENQLPVSILQNDLKTLFLRKNSFPTIQLCNIMYHSFRFLKNLLSAIKGMGTMASMNIWNSLHKTLSTTCHFHLQTLSSSKCLLKISYIIWLSSCCLNTTSIIDVSMPKSISGVISVFDLFASDCIEPLVSDMSQITVEGKWELLQALLSLILAWSEIHCTLCLSSNKYRKETKFPLRSKVEEENFKDLKSLIPFFDQSSFEKFSFLNEEEDTSRSYIIQILIKRLSLSRLQESDIRVRETLPKSSTVTKVVDYILDVRDPSLFPLSSDILALHTPSFLPFLKKKNYVNLARYFVYGIEESKELWIKFGKSQTFRENESLQIQIFSLLCTNVLSLFSGKKRKLDECASEELSKTQILNSLMLKRLTSVQENQTKFASDFILIFSDLEALLKIHGGELFKIKK
ncbi:hypothetical protein Anas_03189 [Armadillidium nasatum]|uniref:Uncharacterized protein n=1 Tax=Armadillidium nasatum TaxID=96803 RepID=A0A5N5TJ38_9CRUS|nr:hypothetical protein Anas_03189 [Armadillidium nasatum]